PRRYDAGDRAERAPSDLRARSRASEAASPATAAPSGTAAGDPSTPSKARAIPGWRRSRTPARAERMSRRKERHWMDAAELKSRIALAHSRLLQAEEAMEASLPHIGQPPPAD